jgi:hypothetical protein
MTHVAANRIRISSAVADTRRASEYGRAGVKVSVEASGNRMVVIA